jgi:hypothetical protein
VCSRLYYLGLCKHTLWCTHNNEIAQQRISCFMGLSFFVSTSFALTNAQKLNHNPITNHLRLRLLCGAGGYPPNVLQPTEAYCTKPTLVSPHSSPEALHIRWCERPQLARGGTMGEKQSIKFSLKCDFHGNCRVLLYTTKLRHGTDGFTFHPKEGVPRIFCLKNPTTPAGFEPANLGTRGQHANH